MWGALLTLEKGERFLLGVAREMPISVVFLQETHTKSDTEVQWRNEWGTNIVLSQLEKKYASARGLGLTDLWKRFVWKQFEYVD